MTSSSHATAAPPMKRGGKLAKWTIGVFFARAFDAVLSFFVAILLANRFGSSPQLDALFLARRATTGMTDLIRELVRKIAMPSMVMAMSRGERMSWQAFPRQALVIMALLVAVPMLLIFSPGQVLAVFAPGFEGERLALASRLLAILIPLLPIAVISGLLLTYLQSAGVFFVGESSKALQRLALVVVLVLFVPPLLVIGIAWTMLIAAVIALAVLALIAWNVHRRSEGEGSPLPENSAARPAIPRGRILAALLIFAYHQLTVVSDFALGSTLPTGGVAALEYGTRLVSLIPGLVTLSVSTVLYPEIVRVMGGDDAGEKTAALHQLLRGTFYLQFPFSLALAWAAGPVVRLLFGHGGFDLAAQASTIEATVYYSLAAVMLMPMNVALNAIYSDSRSSPLRDVSLIFVFGLAVRLALLYLLVPRYGLTGLGIAVVLATISTCLLAITLCRGRYNFLASGKFMSEIGVILACALAGSGAAYAMWLALPEVSSVFGHMWTGSLLGIAVLAGYVGLSLVFRQAESIALVGKLHQIGKGCLRR